MSTQAKRLLSLCLSLAMTLQLCITAPAAQAADEGSAEADSREMWEIALEEGYTHYDTIDMCGGNSHLQGICVDDNMEYMYFSYTSSLAKVDMKTGEVVASVGGFGQGSFGTPGGAHLGCLAYYDGKIYGSLEYKDPGKKFFVAVFDEDAITEVGMDVKEMETGVDGILLYEPTEDFRDPLNDQVSSDDGSAVNEENAGHRYACSGIDGITFGTMPGDESGKMYMFVAYGIYGGDNWNNRYDNNYNILQVYDPEDFTGDVVQRFTYERGLSMEYEPSEALHACDTLFVWTGNTSYGAQNLEWDRETGDLILYTYGNTKGWPGKTMYVVDSSRAPVMREIEVGQSNTNEDPEAQAAAVERAEAYLEEGVYPQGNHVFLKCICGEDCQPQEWGDTGVTAMICGGSQPLNSTTGIASLGNDYYYIADGDTTASLYHRNGDYTFERVQTAKPAKELLRYSMDGADLYEDGGTVYLKDACETGHDAVVQGTSAGSGVTGGEEGALYFNAWNYPAQPDRMFLDSEAIDYINSETDDCAYSYSFWARMAVGADTDGNFDPFIGFYRADGTYAGVFEQRWRTNMKYVVNGIGDSTVGAPGDSGTYLQNGSATPGDEGWHFYTVTENEGSGTLYLDGQPVGTYTVDADHLSEKPFAFFEVGGGMEKLWLDKNNRGRLIGAVDDIAIYSGVLTAEQVAAAYEEKQDQIDSDPEPLPSRADGEEAEADTGFLPAFPVYDRAADAGEGLTVTAERAVTGVAGLSGDSVTVSGQELSFTAEYLSSLDCGIHELSVQYSDGGSGVLPLTVTDSNASSPVPVLSYTMSADAISGGALEDQSVYGMDARISSVESGMSHDGTAEGAAVFDGYQYADPDYATLDGEGALWLSSVLREGYSINFWMNASEENGSVMSMLGLYAADGRPLGAVESFDLSSSSTDKSQDGTFTLQYDMAADPETQFTVRSAENAVHTGEWHQITATYDRAGQTICLYLDGQLCSTQENVTADILGQIAAFRIGSPYKKYYRASGSEDWLTRGGFKGSMDSVTVYPAALTAEQVAELYGDGPSSAKPVIRFTMDAATLNGETILDESGVAGAAANVTPVAGADGQEGGALYFDGTADAGQYSRLWLEQEGIDLLNDAIGSQATIAYWMKPDTTRNPDHTAYSGNWSPVLGLYGGDTRFLMVAEYRNGALNYCCTIPNVNDKRTIGDPLDGDTWYYVVMTFDGSRTESVNGKPSMYRRLYICNASTGEVQEYRPDREAVSEDLFDNIAYFEIGGQPRKGWWTDTNVRGRYIGAVDEVEIYNVPFSAEDVAREFEESVQTVQGLYLPKSFCQADLAGGRDLTVEVANGGQLSGIDGLEPSGYLMEEGLLTIRAAALEALGAGTHVLNLRFADGSCTLTVEVTDSRSAFSPAVPVFEKSSPADVQLTCGTFAGTPVSVTASGLEAEDYTVSGNTITISQRYLMDQQPGAVQLTISASDGTSAQAVIHVTNSAGEGTEPFPVLYYKMDAPDLSPDGQGSSSGRLTEHSGHGISARYSGLESAGADQNGVENGTLFFDGYRDMDISRVYLDQAGMDYLKAVVDNQVSYSFWLSSDRITSNYMPVMGLYGADGRPAAVAQFNSSGGERSGIGAAAAPALVTTPLGSLDPNASHTVAEKTAAMDSTWHHYVVTYDGESGVTAVYVDGTLAATGSAAPDQLADMTSFEIGGLLNTTYYQYGSNLSTWNRGRLYGYLDEVKVYNVALSGSQAEALYQMGVDSELPQDTPEEPEEPDGGDEDGGSSGSSSGSSRYTVAVASGINHGTLSVSPSRASEGDTVTITVTPDSGYELDWLTVSSLAGSEVEVERLSDLRYTFQMPRSRVTVNAQFTPQQSAGEPASGDGQVLSFDDVPEDAWYYDAVQYVCGRGLMQGTGSASFSPADTTTRSMLVTILYRLEGEPPVSAASPFTDVGSGQWYSDAVIWAASNGIADGYGTGLFGPADTITREQMASILYRYTQYKGGDTAQSGDLSTFSDGGSTAAWARDAMSWAIGSGLLSGKDGGRLDPQGSATRAEAATILMRYCQTFLG